MYRVKRPDDLFYDLDRIIDFDAEVANCALDLGMSEQKPGPLGEYLFVY